ncbi:hypothetical protein RND71_022476 [Anisodus tanguticus]|uniref:F-box associated beta-propeller type 1 domain-containing protein n=1 Tax=Anisodus tanguticus TaxID=243964 RepID=A0AAE1RS54_9SOLA|nr:hypothetical protein RND71_022476 [Anisodus tanguticus]
MKDSILTIPILPAELITEILSRVPVKPLLKFSWPRDDDKIYSLKDDSWRSIRYPPPDGVRLWDSGKFVNGKLHWANNIGAVRDKGWNIISFDLANEKWEKVEQPCCEEGGVLVLGVLGNNLSVISKDNHLRTHIDVWVMKEHRVKESWTKMFSVKCPYSPANVDISKNGLNEEKAVEGIFCCYVHEIHERAKSCHFKREGTRKLPDSRTNSRDVSRFINGFGYDELHDDYKLLIFVSCIIENNNYTDRSLYKSRYIISINLVNEKWEKVEQPSYRGDYNLQLGLLGSELSVYINNKEKHVYVWVMKKSWTKLFTVKYADNPDSFAVPFFMSNKGEIVVGFASTFMIYNPKDNSLRPAIMNSDDWWYTEIYVESLVSPFSTGGTSDATKTQAEKVQVKTIK